MLSYSFSVLPKPARGLGKPLKYDSEIGRHYSGITYIYIPFARQSKGHALQPELNSCKIEAASAIAAAVEQSSVSAKLFEKRIASLENICKYLLADKLSKESQISDLRQQQTKLLDGLNGARAELQRLTGAEPKRKRQRAKARSAGEEPLRKGAEDSAVKDHTPRETPSEKSPDLGVETPSTTNQPESHGEEMPTSPRTCPESIDTGLKDSTQHQVPVEPSSPATENQEQDANIQDDEKYQEVPLETHLPSPESPAQHQPAEAEAEPQAPSSLTGDAYYDILGIQFDATAETIKRAYKRRAKELHPDKNADKDAAQEVFTLLGEAYEVLYDSIQKEAYDQSRISGAPFKPAAASDGFVFDPAPPPPAPSATVCDTVRHFLEKKIEERIDRLKKAKPDGWKLSTKTARPIALTQLLDEEPDQPWPES